MVWMCPSKAQFKSHNAFNVSFWARSRKLRVICRKLNTDGAEGHTWRWADFVCTCSLGLANLHRMGLTLERRANFVSPKCIWCIIRSTAHLTLSADVPESSLFYPLGLQIDCLPSFTGVIPIGFLSWNLDKAELLFQTCFYLPLSFKTINCICSPNGVPVTYVICTYDVDEHMLGEGTSHRDTVGGLWSTPWGLVGKSPWAGSVSIPIHWYIYLQYRTIIN